ncbi:MAG: hypothetical protein QOE06_2657 [Thermoleophilaceae bacterium]|jgi:hypothetical protein|nr:hypothetical protein [Thermoleophilaceae bacterium]
MTTQTPRYSDAASAGTPVSGRHAVATFTEYRDAERAIDQLSDQGFPVERTAIVGQGLELVEQVTGRLDNGRAALLGAAQGALVGSLFGWLVVAFNWADAVVPAGWLIVDLFVMGAIFGGILGFVMHAMTGGRRDFASMPAMRAERYQVVVDDALADEAAELLRGASTADGNGASAAEGAPASDGAPSAGGVAPTRRFGRDDTAA